MIESIDSSPSSVWRLQDVDLRADSIIKQWIYKKILTKYNLIITGIVIEMSMPRLRVSHDSTCRTQIGLLKPSDRAERAIDTLGHYHKPSSALGRPRDPEFDGIAAELSWNYFFLV